MTEKLKGDLKKTLTKINEGARIVAFVRAHGSVEAWKSAHRHMPLHERDQLQRQLEDQALAAERKDDKEYSQAYMTGAAIIRGE